MRQVGGVECPATRQSGVDWIDRSLVSMVDKDGGDTLELLMDGEDEKVRHLLCIKYTPREE